MKRWAVATTISGGIGALFMLAAQVSYDEAAGNLASYQKLLAKMGQEPASSILFWVGMGVLVTTLLITTWKLFSRIDKRKGQTAPAAPPADHWANRMRLEISVLANLSAHREPNASPISGEPENSRLRELKDAIDAGDLEAELNGPKPNVMSTVTLKDFEQCIAATNKPYWIEVLNRWQLVQKPPAGELAAAFKRKRIPLLEFIEIANESGWDTLGPDAYEGLDLIHGISEAAGLGDLVILGKQMNRNMPNYTMAGRQRVIPTEFWQQRRIEPLSCFSLDVDGEISGLAAKNETTHTTSDHGDSPATINYSDLHIETDGLLDWLKNDADACRGHHSKAYGD